MPEVLQHTGQFVSQITTRSHQLQILCPLVVGFVYAMFDSSRYNTGSERHTHATKTPLKVSGRLQGVGQKSDCVGRCFAILSTKVCKHQTNISPVHEVRQQLVSHPPNLTVDVVKLDQQKLSVLFQLFFPFLCLWLRKKKTINKFNPVKCLHSGQLLWTTTFLDNCLQSY